MSAFDPLLVSSIGKNWGSIYLATEYYDEALGYGTFEKMALEANTIVNDLPARYEAFAAAENSCWMKLSLFLHISQQAVIRPTSCIHSRDGPARWVNMVCVN